MEKLTTKNTKQEILEAYDEAVARIKALEAGKLDPMKEANAKKVDAVMAKADKIAAEDIVNPKVIEDYNTIKEAIKIAEANLKEVYDIEKTAHTLAALINAQSEKRTSFDAELSAKRAEAEAEVDAMFDKIHESKAAWELELKNAKLATQQTRQREEDEYKYNRDRTRKIDADNWADEKASREKVVADKEAAVAAREQNVAVKEEDILAMEEQIANIPELVKDAKMEAFEEGKKIAGRDYAFEKRALESNFKSEKAILENKIQNQDSTIERLTKELDAVRKELSDARAEVKEIATKTVESAGNSRMVDSLQTIIRDNAKNTK